MSIKNVVIGILTALGILGGGYVAVNQNFSATILFPSGGGTGTSTAPTTNSILIGHASGKYDVKTLTAGTNVTITNAGNTVTVDATGGGSSFPFTPLTNYGVNTSATTTALWAQNGLFASSTSHLVNFDATNSTTTNATTTNFAISALSSELLKVTATGAVVEAVAGTDYENILTAGDGLTRTVNDFDCDTASGSVFGCLSSTDWTTFNNKAGFAWPYTPRSYGNSTSTTIGFLAGMFSVGSTTVSGLTSGVVGNANGLLYGFASSSLFGYTPLNPTRQLTVAGTANQITSSAGAQDLSADRTWTLSLPSHVIFPSSYRAALGSTTAATSTSFFATTASTTNFFGAGLASCQSNNVLTWNAGVFGCEADDTAAGAANPFTWETNYAVLSAATTSPIWAKSGLFASTTSYFVYASSTAITATSLFVTPLTDALVLTGADGKFAEYAGIDCTNQFVRDVSALGAGTCATVGAADVSLANLTATDSTLTFSGTYTGATARTIGLNLGNANTWSALQSFTAGININAASSTVTGNLQISTSSLSTFINPFYTFAFSYASSSQGVGTTTKYIAPVPAGVTWKTAQCETNSFMNVSFYDGTNRLNMIKASSTIGTFSFSSNNTFNSGESTRVDIGTSTSGIGSVNLACRVKYVIN